MRKLFVTLTVILASISAFAQFESGTMMVGGSAGLEFSKNKSKFDGNSSENYRTTEFNLEPQFGYFVIDNLALGAGIGLGVSTTKYDDDFFGDDATSTTSLIAIEPFVRYYLPQRIFFQGKFTLGTGTDKYEEDGETDKENFGVLGLSLAAGYAIMLNDNVAIEPMLGYYTQASKMRDSDVKNVDSGLYLRVGLQVYLR